MAAAELSALSATDVREPLPQEKLLAAITSPPFIYVPGTFNTRDLGLIPTPATTGAAGGAAGPTSGDDGSGRENAIRPGFAFRSGALDGLTPQGKTQLAQELGIRRVFDLRTEGERCSNPDPEVPGVENVWLVTEEKEATAELADFVDGHEDSGYEKMYLDVLRVYKQPFKSVLEHIRDRPEEGFLFHCTAGRDRTGVLASVIHGLAGQDPDTTALDYMLSRVGTEVARELLLAFVMKGTGAASLEAPGLYNLCSLRDSYFRAFSAGVDREYGGFGGYAKLLGFSQEDLDKIRKNLSREWKK